MHIELRDVRVTGYVSRVMITLVVAVSVWSTVDAWRGDTADLLAQILLLPSGAAFFAWYRNATQNAEAIALHGVRLMADVWRASDPAQQEVPFADRTPGVLIKPWQLTFLGMVAFFVLMTLIFRGPAYVVFSTGATVLGLAAGVLAHIVIAKVTHMQHQLGATTHSRGRRGK